jgi:hypothetical protein
MLLNGCNKIILESKQLNRCIPELSPLIMLLKGGNKITLVSKLFSVQVQRKNIIYSLPLRT